MDFAKVQILGRVGNDPDVKTASRGGNVVMEAVLNVATNHRYKDGEGEWQERTNWHRVVVKNQNLVKLVKDKVGKGSQIQLFGHLETRTWEENEERRYITEVVLAGPEAQLIVHQGKEVSKEAAKEESWEDKEQKRMGAEGQPRKAAGGRRRG